MAPWCHDRGVFCARGYWRETIISRVCKVFLELWVRKAVNTCVSSRTEFQLCRAPVRVNDLRSRLIWRLLTPGVRSFSVSSYEYTSFV